MAATGHGKKKAASITSVTVAPAGSLSGELTVPGDKSISHRSVMLGSIAEGVTEVEGFLEGEDNLSTISAFRAMGVSIDRPAPSMVRIEGRGLYGLSEPADVIDAGNSGTTARLLAGLLSAQRFFSVITGDASLRTRPMKRVVEPLRLMGAAIDGRKDATLLPLSISGRRLTGITYATPVASAQLKSAILLAGLYADGSTVVQEPGRSRDHTERMLKYFGATLGISGTSVSLGSTNRLNGCKIKVPGDISSAAFFLAASLITPSSEILVKGVGVNPTRTGVVDILRKMGGLVETLDGAEACGEPVADIRARSSELKGVEISGAELLSAIDEFPLICVVAAFAKGTTRITGAGELRVKESDRIAAMADALCAIGVNAEQLDDGIIIEGRGGRRARGGQVKSLGDHRVAMSMAVAGLMSEKGVEIEDAGAVDVSFPGFFVALDGVRGA